MKNYGIQSLVYGLVLLFIVSCSTQSSQSSAQKDKIMVYAASSLTDVFEELIDTFKVYHQVDVITNLASSGTLARQIEHGAEPDIFVSASKKWADYINELGFFVESMHTTIARNELVLIAPGNSKLVGMNIDSLLNFEQLLKGERLSMGDPMHVPAGKYAMQALNYFGWYASLEKQVLPAKDVRSALRVVELGETPVGIVYKTDALKSAKVVVLGSFPGQSHQPIEYVAGICSLNKSSEAFYAFLNSEAAKPIWNKYGFLK